MKAHTFFISFIVVVHGLLYLAPMGVVFLLWGSFVLQNSDDVVGKVSSVSDTSPDWRVMNPFLFLRACFIDGRHPRCLQNIAWLESGFVTREWPNEVLEVLRENKGN